MSEFPLWKNIKSLLIKIGRIQSTLVMGIIYYLVIGPMAVLYQLLHSSKLTGDSYWIKKEPIPDMKTYLLRQF